MSVIGLWSCGYIGLDNQESLGFDMLMSGGTGSVPDSSGGTGGLQQIFPTGGQPGTGAVGNAGGADTGGMPGVGGEPSWGGFGGLGGYGGAGEPCEIGESCDFECLQSPCRVDCPADSSCEISSDGVPQVIVRCAEGAVCRAAGGDVPSVEFVCLGPGDCESSCDGASQCSAQCVGSGHCSLACQGSACSVQCSSTSQCLMLGGGADKHICAGPKKYCANGVTACNRNCPEQ